VPLFSFVIAVPAALAGPLDPPAGPVESTMKTLSDVEPRIAMDATNTPGDADSYYKITESGSYYLKHPTRALSLGSPIHGIEIAASDVTIDLNGFALTGVGATLDGIHVSAPDLSGIVILNGSISGFAGDGIDTRSMDAGRCEVRGVRVTDAAEYGIRLGDHAVVADCVVSGSGEMGIQIGDSSRVSDCTVLDNGTVAITGAGISTGDDSVVSGCTARENAGTGIAVGSESRVVECIADENDGSGITAEAYSLVSDCLATGNGFQGIGVSVGSAVRSSVTSSNGSSGIGLSAECLAFDNLCTRNLRGMRVDSSGSRIEGNHFVNNGIGLDVAFTDNIILRNTCHINVTNWNIVSGNHVAPIVQASGNGSQITGDTYAGSLGSTDPNANFTY